MNQTIKISVVIPVYNAADLLPRAVGSVMMQDFSDYELILVDDGSTDGSYEVCDDLAANDMHIRVIHKKNGGVSSARNAGIMAAKGEFVMFIDADDAIRDGSLEEMYSRDCDFVLAGFEKIEGISRTESYTPPGNAYYSGTDEICRFFDKVLPKKNTYILNSACFKLFRRSILIDTNIRFVEGLSFAEDKIFVMSFLEHVQKVRTIPSIVYSYFIQPASLSSDMSSDRHIMEVMRLLECYEPVLKKLEDRYYLSVRVSALYHRDLIGRYVCRILGIFATRRTELLTKDAVSRMYGYIGKDTSAGIFSLRFGQIPNMLLYSIGKPGLTVAFYRFTSFISSIIRKSYGKI